MSKFDRKLPEASLAYLETRPAWWQDLLEHRFTDIGGREQPLFLAIRNGYLNAYVEGQSVLELRTSSTAPLGKIHHKYVVDDADGQRHLKFDGSKVGNMPYLGRSSLDKWASKAKTYAKQEKKGVAAIVGRNANVIDVEMTLPAKKAIGAEKRPFALRMDRMDIVALEKDGKGIKIVFYEAKLFRNPELRAKDLEPPVLKQLKRYEHWFNGDNREDEVVNAYRRACGILIRLNATRSEATGRTVHPLVVEAAKQGSNLRVDPKPRLIIFSYKPEERDAYWEPHESVLRRAGIDGDRLIMEPRPEDVALSEVSNSQRT